MMLTLCDILPEVIKLSLILQSENTNFTKLPMYVSSTISSLQEIAETLSGCEHMLQFDRFLDVSTEATLCKTYEMWKSL